MGFIEVLIAALALIVAVWALNLQRQEIRKSGKVNALIHSAHLIQEKIDYHSKIINDMKSQGKAYEDWEGHAHRINKELRPLKSEIDVEFINLVSTYDGLLHEKRVRDAIQNKKN